jgi:hypothetical protein
METKKRLVKELIKGKIRRKNSQAIDMTCVYFG